MLASLTAASASWPALATSRNAPITSCGGLALRICTSTTDTPAPQESRVLCISSAAWACTWPRPVVRIDCSGVLPITSRMALSAVIFTAASGSERLNR